LPVLHRVVPTPTLGRSELARLESRFVTHYH